MLFPLGEAIVKNVQSGSISNIIDAASYAYDKYKDVNKDFIDSPFITNHDMNRSMDSFSDLDSAKQAAAILLTLPETPYDYYGEETGMTGSKPDEQIRQPFIWDNKDLSKKF